VVRDSQGRHYLLYGYATQIKVFDAKGLYLRALGRKGAGPGEFEGVSGVHVDAGDSLHVLDWGTSRHTVFGPDFRLIRSNPIGLQPQMSWLMLPDGRTVVNLTIRSPEKLGLPLHLLDADGTLLRSFGSDSKGAYRPDFPGMGERALAPHRGTLVWAAHQSAYAIDLVDVNSGEIVKRLIREASWLPASAPQRTSMRPPAEIPPPSTLAAIHEDAEGLLWVLISVADSRWKSAVQARDARHLTITDPVRYTDHIIDVIDPARGRVVASVRFDERPPWFVSRGYAAQFASGARDVPVFDVFRMALKRP